MPELPFSDFGLKWFEDIVAKIIEWFRNELVEGLLNTTISLLETPLPDGQGTALIFSKPNESDEIWYSIYEATVAGEMMVIGLLILFLCVQGRHFIRIFNFSSAYESRKARRSSWTGAFLILAWYWIAVLVLYFVQALTIGLVPNMKQVAGSLVEILPQAAGSPGLTLVMAVLGGLSMVALKALFFLREVLLYVYLYGMPVGIAIAFGNIPVLSNIARGITSQFVPLAVLPLPAAMLFRGYELLFAGDTQLPVEGDFLQYLVVVSLPMMALYVTWKSFKYASPLAARVIGGVGRGAMLAGTAAAAGYVGGPAAAAAGAKWGPKAAAGSALASRQYSSTTEQPDVTPLPAATDTDGDQQQGGVPKYRRPENDPGYY